MTDVAEKRVYDDAADDRTAFVAGGSGVVAVRVSAGDVGQFGLVDDCAARDAAAAPPDAGWPPVAVAAADDVRVGDADGLAPAGFGPSVAVGFDGGALLAAGPDGRVAGATPPDERTGDGDLATGAAPETAVEWTDLGTAGDVRAVDGRLVAAADGVFRVREGGLTAAGLADVRDVAAAGPLAATGDGLYRLGNGWQDVLEGAFRVVTAELGGRGRALAGTDDGAWVRHEGEWAAVDLPASVAGESVVDADYGAATYAVTDAGTLLARGGGTVDAGAGDGVNDDPTATGGGWRAHPLGMREVAAIAVTGGDGQP